MGASVCPASVSTHATLPPPDTSSCGVYPPVHQANVPRHTPQCPQSLGRPPPVRHGWLYNTGRHTPTHPCDTLCRAANRSDSQAIPSLWPVTPPVASELNPEVRGSRSNLLPSFATSCVRLELESLSSTGITLASAGIRTRPPSPTARPYPRGSPVGRYRPPLGNSRVASIPLHTRAAVTTPAD